MKESAAGMGLLCFVAGPLAGAALSKWAVVVMCVFGLLMSQSISQVALLPPVQPDLDSEDLASFQRGGSGMPFAGSFRQAGVALDWAQLLPHLASYLAPTSSMPVKKSTAAEKLFFSDQRQQIFKYTTDLKDEDESEDEDEDEYQESLEEDHLLAQDVEHSSEFMLLEKVVKKLAAIAHLSSAAGERRL
ncbi:hypothetical protein AK812_SmicGene21153 [Symbiodinium microadriaticum]|uniref:Uncharacterized protein n=1 Tax=Symbiodinium microadriaticum TaxID=2951 RepID=A0A1Q9DN83_SYMMI|nr:hypothetical protein AK812_SmicGene21153 [Symbiodinium microadriaticum]